MSIRFFASTNPFLPAIDPFLPAIDPFFPAANPSLSASDLFISTCLLSPIIVGFYIPLSSIYGISVIQNMRKLFFIRKSIIDLDNITILIYMKEII